MEVISRNERILQIMFFVNYTSCLCSDFYRDFTIILLMRSECTSVCLETFERGRRACCLTVVFFD